MYVRNYFSARWVLRNGPIIYRALKGFSRALFMKKNTLKVIELFPTFECPSSCHMCSVEKYKKKKDPVLSLDDYKRIAEEGARMGAIAVSVLGGEPFSYIHLKELIKICSHEKLFCNIVTGGTLVDGTRLSDLKKAGVGSILFSLESLDERRNDGIRGKGHLKKTMENLDLCSKLGIQAGIATLFEPGRMSDALEVIQYTREKKLLAAASQVAASGRSEEARLLDRNQHDQVRKIVRDYPHLTLDWTMSYFLRQQCPAGKEKIGITCHGDVIGCSINSISFGNVRKEPMERIWERMGKFSQFAKNSKVCLAAEDSEYIEKYLGPLKELREYPMHYQRHPLIQPGHEKHLY